MHGCRKVLLLVIGQSQAVLDFGRVGRFFGPGGELRDYSRKVAGREQLARFFQRLPGVAIGLLRADCGAFEQSN